MKRTVVITQPTYLPWLGYFEQMQRADVFVFLDSVQFERRSWQCRNRIKGVNGEPMWLTVPLKHQPRETAICDILTSTDHPGWGRSHLNTITDRLRRAPYFEEVRTIIEPFLRESPARLADVNIGLIRAFATRLGLAPEFLRSSELPVVDRKADLIVNLCRHVGATDYYSAAGSAVYLEQARDLFAAAGIRYGYQTWQHPQYPQGGDTFVSHLAIVDALSWIGFDAVAALLRSDSETNLQPLLAHAS
jgi:hypothetical protein